MYLKGDTVAYFNIRKWRSPSYCTIMFGKTDFSLKVCKSYIMTLHLWLDKSAHGE